MVPRIRRASRALWFSLRSEASKRLIQRIDRQVTRDLLTRRLAMNVLVNGVRLFFDVEGGKLVPDGSFMREKPTLLMLHGGPGSDHSIYKPAYSGLADVAQIIYLDPRGHGRSDDGPRQRWDHAQLRDARR